MAETFSIQTPDAVTQQGNAPGPRQVSAQPDAIGGGLSALPTINTSASDRTTEAILKLGSDILTPKIKEEAQRQYMVGVQQAQTGQALSEIVEQQPWYSQIFGPASAAQGARAYTAQMNVAKFGADLERQMPILAQKGPQALTDAAAASIKTQMTGDPTTDAAITTAYVEQMAPLYKRHAKENYIYTQKRAVDAQTQAWDALGTVYQQQAAAGARPDGGVSPEDVKGARARFIGALAPFADQSEDSYNKSMFDFLQNSASKGNFQVIKMFKEEGLYDKLDVEHKTALDRSLKGFGREALNQTMPTYAEEIGRALHDSTQTPQALIGKLDAINAKAASSTGVSETELIPKSTYDNAVGALIGRQQSAQDKQAIEDGKVALGRSLISVPGAIDQAQDLGLLDKNHIERATAAECAGNTDPAYRAKLLNARTGGTAGFAKTELNTLVVGDEYNQGIAYASQVYDKLDDGVKANYFGDKDRKFLDNFNRQVRSGVKPDQAFVNARFLAPLAEDMLPTDAKSEASKLIRKEVESKHETWYGLNEIDDSALLLYEMAANKTIKADHGTNGMEVAVKRAVGQAKAQGIQQIGKHAALAAHPDDPELAVMLAKGENNAGPKEVGKAFETLMADSAKARGLSLDHYTITRPKDRGGKALFYVEAGDGEKTGSFTISSDEVRAQIGKTPVDTSSVLGSVRNATAAYKANRPTGDVPLVNQVIGGDN